MPTAEPAAGSGARAGRRVAQLLDAYRPDPTPTPTPTKGDWLLILDANA
jgi:hypothetical protein